MPLEPALFAGLSAHAAAADQNLVWPQPSIDLLARLGAHRWSLAPEFGGADLPAPALQEATFELGRACLTTAFVFSQREAAVRRLQTSRDRPIAQELLPRLARGELWSTVGVAQLTSSRQHLGPALRATPDGDGLRLDGFVPWVSGAAAADFLIVGALRGDEPILAVLPRGTPGLTLQPPMELLALRGSLTAELKLDGVRLDPRFLLEDRPEKVNAGDGAGGLTTSCLALALAAAALDHLQAEAARRPELAATAERLAARQQELRRELMELAKEARPDVGRFPRLRAAATQAALRATQAALAASKGVGFVQPHPAQRWARQALFFLVWSCPRPTAEAVMAAVCAE